MARQASWGARGASSSVPAAAVVGGSTWCGVNVIFHVFGRFRSSLVRGAPSSLLGFVSQL
eukprot:4484848-Prymnesium_polylepis.2